MHHEKTYSPMPLKTGEVEVPDNLRPLVERIAEHVHDIWTLRRIEEGWRYGPQRDDKLKEHPNLVPYKTLAESDKDYDRAMVMEAVKVALLLGYDIVKVD